jgi:5-methylthioadenosine/S-adenosylhomocysteine deaminase
MTMGARDLVLRGGTIITVDDGRLVIDDGTVVCTDGTITFVGPTAEAPSPPHHTVVDIRGKYVIPGLINTHSHLFQTMLKGLGDDRVLIDWFRCMTGPSAAHLTADDCEVAALCGSLEAVRSGTTCLVDFMYAHPRPELTDAVARGLTRSGIRAILGRGFNDSGSAEDVPSALIEPLDQVLGDARRVIDLYHGAADGRLSVRLAPCMIWSVSQDALAATRELADETGVGIMMHVAETPYEVLVSQQRYRSTEVAYLDSLGILGPDFLAVHCVQVTEADIEVLAGRDVRVSHNPTSNMYLASGVAPIRAMLDAGIAVGLACDGAASNSNHNMIESMKMASLLQKVGMRDPLACTAEKALEMATIDAARSVGMETIIGSIEPGKRADLVVLDLAASLFAGPVHHPVSSLVYSALGNEVDMVVVDGRVLLEHGVFVEQDPQAVLDACGAAAGALVDRAGTGWLRERPWRSVTPAAVGGRV